MSAIGSLIGFVAFIFLIVMIVGLIKPSILTLTSRKKVITIFGGIFVVLFITAVSFPEETPDSPKNEEQMKLDLKLSPDGSVLGIRNLNSFDWRDCEITINDSFRVKEKFLARTSGENSDLTDANVISLDLFTKEDGTMFNNKTQRILNITTICKDPYFGFNSADSKQ